MDEEIADQESGKFLLGYAAELVHGSVEVRWVRQMRGIRLADRLPVVTRFGGGAEHGAASRLPVQVVFDETAHSPLTAGRLGVPVGLTDAGINISPFVRHLAPDVDWSPHSGSPRLG